MVALFKFKWRRSRPPIAVVLGAGIDLTGAPAESTRLRARAAAKLAAEHPEIKIIILSGYGPNADQRSVSEARMMSDVLAGHGIGKSRMLLEDESIDTLGNAVLVAARYLHESRPRKLFLITSPFHIERSLVIFRQTLGPAWQVEPYASEAARDDSDRAATEPGGRVWAEQFFAGIKPGDLSNIVKKLQLEKPYYSQLDWLDACKYPSGCGSWYRLRCRARRHLCRNRHKHCYL